MPLPDFAAHARLSEGLEAPLYLDTIPLAGKVKLIHLDAGSTRFWESWMTSDLQLSASASYGAPLADYNQSKNDRLNLFAVVGATLGLDAPIDTLATQEQTVLTWNGTDGPVFNIEMLFISLDDDAATEEKAVSLSQLVHPRRNGVNLDRPAGYRFGRKEDSGGVNGTFTLKIGEYLRVRHLVLTGADPTFSSQRTRKKEPLFARVSCTLQPYRTITEDEYRSWFTRLSGSQ